MFKNKEKVRVLFLCTGNSCRSQIAEGWARYLKGDVVEPYSAGVCPAGVSPEAIRVMAEAGVDISGHRSKHVDELTGIDFDYVITLCDNAREHCLVLPSRIGHIHKPFQDPSLITGTQKEVIATFRRTRDEIKAFIETLPETLEKLAKDGHEG